MNLTPASEVPTRILASTLPRPQVKSLAYLEALKEYPFLRAALEDIEEANLCVSREIPNRRHVICLMFDALEFVLYEILLLHENDIYKTGQSTIGFDDALSISQKLGVNIPLIGTVRQIQKHRGDAKHHAQTPDEPAYQSICRNFQIIVSRLVHEQFEGVVGDVVKDFGLLNHRFALFECYRRQRNHDWERAYRFVLGALLRKHQEMLGNRSGSAFNFAVGHAGQLKTLEVEIAATNYPVAPRTTAAALKALVEQVRVAISDGNWENAASLVANAYSISDELVPKSFEINRALRLTNKLYLPSSFRYGKPMAWAKVWGQQGSKEEASAHAVVAFLKANSDVVKMFGQPNYAEDDDRYRRWWEFAIFDGERWHTFHLDTDYAVALEIGFDSSGEHRNSADLLNLILEELREVRDATKKA